MFKKVIITNFAADGTISTTATLTLKRNVVATDFAEAKEQVKRVLASHLVSDSLLVVEWKRNGYREGFAIK